MKLLKGTFKLPVIISTIFLDFAKNIVVPGQKLMIWLFIIFLLDFITGIIKAYLIGEEITSKRMRDSIGKMLQYAGLILLVMIMANATFKEEIAKAGFIIDGIYMLAILIETRSICENFKAMAPESAVTKLILNPLLLVFEKQTKAISNNLPMPEAPKADTTVLPPVVKSIVILCLALPFMSFTKAAQLTYEQQQFLSNALPAAYSILAVIGGCIFLLLLGIAFLYTQNKEIKNPKQ